MTPPRKTVKWKKYHAVILYLILPNIPRLHLSKWKRTICEDSTFPSNADQIAAGNNGIELTEEQHRILTSQSEGTAFLYNVPENRQRVEGSEPNLCMTNEERAALTQAHDALHLGIRLKGTNANPDRPSLTSLIRPQDPPILMAFVQELDNWPQLDQYLNEAFGEER